MALELGALGGRSVRPNPLVGAALQLTDGRLLASFHKKSGGPHAEIEVLKACERYGMKTEGATLAVTLEPCSHFGKTPPCVDAILKAGIKKILVGVEDPNPLVQGRGIKKLREEGVQVEVGILKSECEALNVEWFVSQRLQRPYVYLKKATTQDGAWKIETRRWITGEEARLHAHILRSYVDALVTSVKTVVDDDPAMTARQIDGVTLRSDQPKVFVISQKEISPLYGKKILSHPGGVNFVQVNSLKDFLGTLFKQGLHFVMVEAGPRLTSAFENAGLWDEIWHYEAAGKGDTRQDGKMPTSFEIVQFANGDCLHKSYRQR